MQLFVRCFDTLAKDEMYAMQVCAPCILNVRSGSLFSEIKTGKSMTLNAKLKDPERDL